MTIQLLFVYLLHCICLNCMPSISVELLSICTAALHLINLQLMNSYQLPAVGSYVRGTARHSCTGCACSVNVVQL
jgi:hypothetical protein